MSRAYAANGLNQYTSGGPATFSYDPNGNLTGDGTSGYGYDVENRLISRSNGLAIAYDPNGRLWQTSGGASGTTRYLYDGDNLVAEYDASGTMLKRYVFGPGVDEPVAEDSGSLLNCTSTRFLHPDAQGSIIATADCNGNPVAINTYDEYGIPGLSVTGVSNTGRFRYTGQIWLPDLGMYYYKARIYSPTLGRFLQTDPIGYKDQVNLYAYVANDPVNGTDPSGESITEIGFLIYDVATTVGHVANGASAGELLNDAANIALDVAPIPGLREVKGAAEVVRAVEHGAEAARAARGAAGGERAGRSFTQRGREAIDSRNVERHGKPTCESCKREVTPGQRSERGVTPPGNERQRDHIVPRSRGGDGIPNNGQVLCRDCNLKKRDRMPD